MSQRFTNPSKDRIEVVYVFPLPEHAAVAQGRPAMRPFTIKRRRCPRSRSARARTSGENADRLAVSDARPARLPEPKNGAIAKLWGRATITALERRPPGAIDPEAITRVALAHDL